MSFSIQRAVSDGTLDTIVLSIEYFDKTDISVYVDDVLLPDGTYTWAWDGLDIKITPAVANGSEVLVRRTTKFDDMYHNFDDGAVFNDTTMDDNFRQLLFIFQEGVEGLTATDFYADLNLHGYRLRKVGNAVEPDDAVPFSQYQADSNGAFQQRQLAEAAATAASTSQTAAASSAVSAANSAASASASAATATTAATSASNSAASASTSETNAAASALSADASADAAALSAADAAASAASINPANLVHIAGTETITGAKTFSVSPVVPNGGASGAAVNKSQLDTKVSLTGDESIAGIKTFTSSPVLPGNATTALQAVPKQQLDAAKPVLSVSQTLTGLNVDFSVPAGVNLVRLQFVGLSVSAGNIPRVQLVVGSPETTGYQGTAVVLTAATATAQITNGFPLAQSIAANWVISGVLEISRVAGNDWVVTGTGSIATGAVGAHVYSGSKSLAGQLTGIRLTIAGADTFDGGTASVWYT